MAKYKVCIPSRIEEQIDCWELPKHVKSQFRSHLLRKLGEKTLVELNVRRIAAPVRALTYNFSIRVDACLCENFVIYFEEIDGDRVVKYIHRYARKTSE